MSWPKWFSIRTVVGLIVVGCGLAGCSQREPDPEESPNRARPATGQVRVADASLQHLKIQEVSATGDAATVWSPGRLAIRSERVADVQTPVAGRVTAVHVQVGDAVKAGDVLATLVSPEASRYRMELENAKIERSVAEAEARRQRVMNERGVGTESELSLAEAKLLQAKNEVDRAAHAASFLGEADSDTVLLKAPLDGIVLARHVTVGAQVDPGGDPEFLVGDPAGLHVVAEVFESDLIGVSEGAAARIETPSIAQPLTGKVRRVGAALNEETRRAQVYVSLDEPHAGLRAGMLARVGIQVQGQSGFSVPLSAVLIKDGERSVVFVQVEGALFEAREVALGSPSRGFVPVLSGLRPGERIVVKGGLLLDGAASQGL